MDLPNDFVHGVEHKRVSPQCDGNSVVAKGQAKCTDEQALRVGEYPYAQHDQQIHKVTQVSQKVVVALLMVGVPAYGHEVEQLNTVPVRVQMRPATHKVTTHKDVHDACDEGNLFAQRDRP